MKFPTQSLSSKLPFFRPKKAPSRRHVRHECFAPGALTFVDRSFSLEGAITELSLGGLNFRPGTVYILNRTGEVVTVLIGDRHVSGKIMNANPSGYGILLFDELEEEFVDKFIAENNLDEHYALLKPAQGVA
jgi:hypothetical protein